MGTAYRTCRQQVYWHTDRPRQHPSPPPASSPAADCRCACTVACAILYSSVRKCQRWANCQTTKSYKFFCSKGGIRAPEIRSHFGLHCFVGVATGPKTRHLYRLVPSAQDTYDRTAQFNLTIPTGESRQDGPRHAHSEPPQPAACTEQPWKESFYLPICDHVQQACHRQGS